MPEFISSKMQGVIYPLLAHPQLSIRENASKAFSSFLAHFPVKYDHDCIFSLGANDSQFIMIMIVFSVWLPRVESHARIHQ